MITSANIEKKKINLETFENRAEFMKRLIRAPELSRHEHNVKGKSQGIVEQQFSSGVRLQSSESREFNIRQEDLFTQELNSNIGEFETSYKAPTEEHDEIRKIGKTMLEVGGNRPQIQVQEVDMPGKTRESKNERKEEQIKPAFPARGVLTMQQRAQREEQQR